MGQNKREVRFISREVRAADKRTIKGYAAVFNSLSEDLGGFREIIAPNAFKRCLSNGADVRCLVDHESSKILGRTKSGTLRLSEDSTGLAIECDLPNTTLANDTLESIRRGDLNQMSFGFTCADDDWDVQNGTNVRTVRDADLFDVSVVTYPAYQASSVGVARSLRSLWPDGKPEFLEASAIEKRMAFLQSTGVLQGNTVQKKAEEADNTVSRFLTRYYNLFR